MVSLFSKAKKGQAYSSLECVSNIVYGISLGDHLLRIYIWHSKASHAAYTTFKIVVLNYFPLLR
jgi:hypothetical protein